ncbi:2-keto-3-deoxy-L-rhamnonate aldolase [Jannaschia sp. Os4]|uniref:HpcH/HpaI aldolase family protein n=1 Tax=Jannaschia sp. Os4 TaxID=2807617 RepID=UPI00193A9ADE|nr:aldolase/citrate lyase family protein [Jannaschia sp. Os4]MBM2577877.1 2-keto-3-deoxy-L-rhamnonate aldolase [Jannaschia sp. Os4]
MLKQRVRAGEVLRGLWQTLPGPVAAEIADGAGFDWLMLDGEHGPWDPADLRARAIACRRTPTIVRVPVAEPWVIKQALDLGIGTVLAPMVHSAAQATEVVAACRYVGGGRGQGSFIARASGWGRDAGYAARADGEVSVWVQAESRAALAELEGICAVEGVDCVFLGPADLAGDMGMPVSDPSVQDALRDAIRRIRGAGVAAGIYAADPEGWIAEGATVVSMGCDAPLLAAALDAAR